MKDLTCMIVDGEPAAAGLLQQLIRQHTGWRIATISCSGTEALDTVQKQKIDFLFLDINLPGLSGLQLAAMLPKETKIIFSSASPDHALESYNYSAIDYLLKPVCLSRFLLSKLKIEAQFAIEKTNIPYLFFKIGKNLHKVLLDQIFYFAGEKEYVRLVTTDRELLIYKRLKDVEENLTSPFIRIHNSFIINITRIVKVQDNHVHIGLRQIPIGDKFRSAFLERISSHVF